MDMQTPLTEFPVTHRWPATRPNVLQLYSLPTQNGTKVSIALEEMGLEYEAHRVPFGSEGTQSPDFQFLNPNKKIPAIIDPDGPDGRPIALFESGAILIYLAEKTGKFLPRGSARYNVIKWLMFQMGGLGPMFGQLGYFAKFKGAEIEDPRPRERYIDESKRLLNVLEAELEGKQWIAGEYSIADMAIGPWLWGLGNYGVYDLVGWNELRNVPAYLNRFLARPAVQRGLKVPAREA